MLNKNKVNENKKNIKIVMSVLLTFSIFPITFFGFDNVSFFEKDNRNISGNQDSEIHQDNSTNVNVDNSETSNNYSRSIVDDKDDDNSIIDENNDMPFRFNKNDWNMGNGVKYDYSSDSYCIIGRENFDISFIEYTSNINLNESVQLGIKIIESEENNDSIVLSYKEHNLFFPGVDSKWIEFNDGHNQDKRKLPSKIDVSKDFLINYSPKSTNNNKIIHQYGIKYLSVDEEMETQIQHDENFSGIVSSVVDVESENVLKIGGYKGMCFRILGFKIE